MKIASVIGTRPEIIKMANLINEIKKDNFFEQIIVHSGQHYDELMSDIFIRQLSLPKPNYFLQTGSGTQAEELAKMTVEFEKVFKKERPDIVIVPTDTNTSLASALAAAKLGIFTIHMEAGCRSFDLTMPEEIDRKLITHCCDFHFAPTKLCYDNLVNEGIEKDGIELTGHTIVDIINDFYNRQTGILEKYDLVEKEFCLLTFHRQENTDNIERIKNIVEALSRIKYKIIFPIHPRTKKRLNEFGLWEKLSKMKNVVVIDPIGYLEMLELIENAKFVLTDSGGMQQESFVLKTPCITLRYNTEWYETLELGCNFLVGTDPQAIILTVENIEKNYDKIMNNFEKESPFGSGNVAKKMIEVIKRLEKTNSLKKKSLNMIISGYPRRK